jgi:hypothetical protein
VPPLALSSQSFTLLNYSLPSFFFSLLSFIAFWHTLYFAYLSDFFFSSPLTNTQLHQEEDFFGLLMDGAQLPRTAPGTQLINKCWIWGHFCVII